MVLVEVVEDITMAMRLIMSLIHQDWMEVVLHVGLVVEGPEREVCHVKWNAMAPQPEVFWALQGENHQLVQQPPI